MGAVAYKGMTRVTGGAVAVSLLLLGCSLTSRPRSISSVGHEPLIACRKYAVAQKNEITGVSRGELLRTMSILGPLSLAMFGVPALVHMPEAYRNDQMRAARYEEALKGCLQPTDASREYPNLAVAFRALGKKDFLAKRYAEAEILYRQALVIQEKLPEDVALATTLDDYAELLWRIDRKLEAERMAHRANAIRAKLDQ